MKPTELCRVVLATTLFVLTCNTAMAANLIVNGDFENEPPRESDDDGWGAVLNQCAPFAQ